MRIIAGGTDITELVEKVVWSGNDTEIARTLTVSTVSKHSDPVIPRVSVTMGDTMAMLEGGGLLFFGVVFDVDTTAAGCTSSFFAFDLAVYLKSEISRIFDATPEEITQMVCKDLGVPFGAAAPTGVKVYLPHLGKSAYDAIMAAYAEAAKTTGKQYSLQMEGNQLNVTEKGLPSGAVLDGYSNHIDSSHKQSIRNVVDQVLITDNSGSVIGKVKNDEHLQKYGTLQRVYQQEDGKDAQTAAKALLQAPEATASFEGLSDLRCKAGYAVELYDDATGLYGLFFITSDTHTFENGITRMSLELAFHQT